MSYIIKGNEKPIIGETEVYSLEDKKGILFTKIENNVIYEWFVFKKQKNGLFVNVTRNNIPKIGHSVPFSFNYAQIEYRLDVYEVKKDIFTQEEKRGFINSFHLTPINKGSQKQIKGIVLYNDDSNDLNQASIYSVLTVKFLGISLSNEKIKVFVWKKGDKESLLNTKYISVNHQKIGLTQFNVNNLLSPIDQMDLMAGAKDKFDFFVTATYQDSISVTNKVPVTVTNKFVPFKKIDNGKSPAIVQSSPKPTLPKTNIIPPYIISAEWQNHLGKKIKRAIYGQTVYLKVKIDYEKLKTWGNSEYLLEFDLYHKNNADKLVYIPLIYLNSKTPYTQITISEQGEAKIEIKLLREGFEDDVKKEEDLLYHLFCECQIVKKDNLQIIQQKVDLPKDNKEYLAVGEIVIDRYKVPGLNEDGSDIAEDMAYGNGVNPKKPIYTEEERKEYIDNYRKKGFDLKRDSHFSNLRDKTTSFKTIYKWDDFINVKYIKEYIYKDDKHLWFLFRDLKKVLVWGELSSVLDQMINKFIAREGGIYENSILTENIKNADSTIRYCTQVENYIAEKLKNDFSNLEKIEDLEIDYAIGYTDEENLIPFLKTRRKKAKITGQKTNDGKEQTFTTPLFSFDRYSENNLFSGRTLALNDIWAAEVIIKEINIKNNNSYIILYEITLWDHFGLNLSDIQKFDNMHFGFQAWFILQHVKDYNPFITKITFEKEFSGNLNQGREERIKAKKLNDEKNRKEIEKLAEEYKDYYRNKL